MACATTEVPSKNEAGRTPLVRSIIYKPGFIALVDVVYVKAYLIGDDKISRANFFSQTSNSRERNNDFNSQRLERSDISPSRYGRRQDTNKISGRVINLG